MQTGSKRRNKVLILNDDASQISFFTSVFDSLGSTMVYTAKRISDALSLAEDHHFELFVVSWNDDSINGGVFLQQIRDISYYFSTPIFLSVSQFDSSKAYLGLEFNASDLLVAPFEFRAIKQMFSQQLHIEKAPAQRGNSRETILKKIELLLQHKQYTTGREIADVYVEEFGNDSGITFKYALIFEGMGLYDEAVSHAQRCFTDDEYYIPALGLIGRVHMKTNNIHAAIAQFEKAKALSPHNIKRLLSLGNSYFDVGDFEKSNDNYRAAYDLDSSNQEAIVGLSQNMMADNSDDLVAAVKKTYKSTRHVAILNALAILLSKKKRFDEAGELYDSAIALAAGKPDLTAKIHFNHGLMYLRMKQTSLASGAFKNALDSSPDFIKAKRQLELLRKNTTSFEVGANSEKSAEIESTRSDHVQNIAQKLSTIDDPEALTKGQHARSPMFFDHLINVGQLLPQCENLYEMLLRMSDAFKDCFANESTYLLKVILEKEPTSKVINGPDESLICRVIDKLERSNKGDSGWLIDRQRLPIENVAWEYLLVLPLYKEDSVRYVLAIYTTERALSELNIQPAQLNFISHHVSSAVTSAIELKKVTDMLEIDELTGLYNAKVLDSAMDKAIIDCKNDSGKVTIMFFDLDRFKSVNDTHGHLIGSRLLVEFAVVLREMAHENDVLIRYGGDEYVLISSAVSAKEASEWAEKIRQKVETHAFLNDREKPINLTVSIGLAFYPDHAQSGRDVLKLADFAMYEAKNRSRNSVTVAELPKIAS